ncbi:MAG: EFR1 family ferrodoxin [Eggerthella lenta]
MRFRGLASVLMPENYLALYDTPDEAECRALIERAKPRIDEVADLVRRGEPLPEEPVTAKGRFRSGPENALFYPVLVHDAKFVATDACTACGTCVRRCPLNNIALAGGKPAWNGSCTHCMACIAGCPTRAIEYGQKSKARHRHDIWTDAGDGACGGDAR